MTKYYVFLCCDSHWATMTAMQTFIFTASIAMSIGQSLRIEMYARGFDQSHSSHGYYASIKLDGGPDLVEPNFRDMYNMSEMYHPRGYNVVTIDELTGMFQNSAHFDTYTHPYADLDFLHFLNDLSSPHTIVAIVTFDSAARYDNRSFSLLQAWGCALAPFGHRDAFLFLGAPSASYNPSWQTCATSTRYDSAIWDTFQVPLFESPEPSQHPSAVPTVAPTDVPTNIASEPTSNPSSQPSMVPTQHIS